MARHKRDPSRPYATSSHDSAGLTDNDKTMEEGKQPLEQEAPHKPHVSEAGEGKPIAEWAVGLLVALSAILAACGRTFVGTLLMALTALCLGVMRLRLRGRSPWKVRSVAFDAFICIGLGLGLVATYLSVMLLL
ncbi:DUF3017 domain-containing protein [Bifidobacterium actinocoloniiforme]|uniref:DUF3017 domain-containing protein n=1 Tax=Bifidobacterium actinocoloniiforme TaxID=638619 RepID=UPI001F433CB5|nr:DUF3017 domain-containing protein [Bifidobacterium actinocoloniiforme]